MRYLLYSLLLAILPFIGSSQTDGLMNFPKGYFRNPLTIPIDLSGNFGELRPNHYHMGLDLKTKARENLPVYASAEGYIARIKIEPAGFGRAIYVNHPNGYTTLYAHLNNFNPALEKWVKEQQYNQESWNVFLELTPDLFPVRKGDFLAYSGNTGGSQAPHLHFEIRETENDVNVNPMLFGFQIADNTQPRLSRIALYDRRKSIYEQSPLIFPLKPAGSNYTTVTPLVKTSSPKISLALNGFDTHTGSSNQNGIYQVQLYINESPSIAFRMERISYNDTRYLNAHIDYKTRSLSGPYLQQLSELPGYLNSIYDKSDGDGILYFTDGEIKSIKIVAKDAYGNSSTVIARIQYVAPPAWQQVLSPDKMFYPLMLDGYESNYCEFYIGERCLYDSVHIRYASLASTNVAAVSGLHAIGSASIPLQEAFLIRIRPTKNVDAFEKTRTVMQWYAGSKKVVQKVEWQGDWASARFRDFGYYQLLLDTIPPKIVPIGMIDGANMSKASRILFTVKDNLERFKNVRAEIDGKWIRFTNDKGRTFSYVFDEKCLSGAHSLKIYAEDEAGNSAVKLLRFTR